MSEDQDKNKGPFLSISSLAVILAAVGFTIFTQVPFNPSRPSVPDMRESHEKIVARLWQDPFCAVVEGEARKKGSGKESPGESKPPSEPDRHDYCRMDSKEYSPPLDNIRKMIAEKRENIVILGVMVYGGLFAEETEIRIRHRYAALSALGRLGFVPEDPDHIDYMKVARKEVRESVKVSLSNIIPFEWLKYRGKLKDRENDSVLLLWLNNDLFQEQPLSKLVSLVQCLDPSKPPKGKNHRLKFKVIGPAESTTLLEMLREARFESPGELSNMEIYSAMATVDDEILLKSVTGRALQEGSTVAPGMVVEKIEGKAEGLRFERTIGSDRSLAEKLIAELQNRRVDFRTDHLVLVSEWDTYYGQSLPETFKRVIRERTGADPREVEKRVHRVSYLRGIDGILPGGEDEKKDDPSNRKDKGEEVTKKLEQPTGRSQYDYLRRLTEELYRFDKTLKEKGEAIKAIGILGNDFYDKSLTLQALRQRFPQAIFFTTDLDARLQHPANIEWTRNLIVASPFDLSLRKDPEIDLQGEIPPFRDSYQTSLFFTVLKTFANDGYLEREREYLRRSPAPLLFEIGHNRSVMLDDPQGVDAQPRRQRGDIASKFRAVLLVAGLSFLFLMLTSGRFHRLIMSRLSNWKNIGITAIAIAMVVSAFIIFQRKILNVPTEEPFSLFEGVSIWPTELLRLAALLLCLYFLRSASVALQQNSTEITDDFKLKKPEEKTVQGSIWRRMREALRKSAQIGYLKSIFFLLKDYWHKAQYEWPGEERKEMDDLWEKYLRRDSGWYRFMRISPIVFLYWIVCSRVVLFFGSPFRPVRGYFSNILDLGILGINVVAFTILIFYVFDVSRVCRQFITNASQKKPEWTGKSRSAFFKDSADHDIALQDEWMLVCLVARLTDAVGKLIFYPCIIWLILYFSRTPYFDNWQTSIGLFIVLSLGAVYAWYCAFSLRNAAEKCRDRTLQRLSEKYMSSLTYSNFIAGEATRIQSLIKEIKEIRQGAFAPILRHPVLQSLLVPFGGMGGAYVIDLLLKMNV